MMWRKDRINFPLPHADDERKTSWAVCWWNLVIAVEQEAYIKAEALQRDSIPSVERYLWH
jgi:hypothetical protein